VTDPLRSSSAHVFVDDIDDPALADEDLHHLARVLRLRAGEPVSVCDGRGSWRMTQWRDGALIAAGEVRCDPAPPAVAVAFAPVKGDRSESAVEKMVEIGVGRIIVLAPTEHSVVRWDTARAEANIARYARIARAAASQSRRTHLPVVEGPVRLGDVTGDGSVALAEPGGPPSLDGVAVIVVGPEGGFSAAEVAAAGRTVSLGSTILRADTAAVVAATLLVAHSGR
jgi:16S rRNA (uracil1498-N3)-methyltransferase